MEREPQPSTPTLTGAVSTDYPEVTEVLVSFADQWELIGRIRREDTPLYVAAMPLSQEIPRRDHFHGLPPEVNLTLDTYRLYKLFQPWPTPSVTISWNQTTGTGRVEGVGDLKVQLKPLGQGQAWKGRTYGVLWECYLSDPAREATTRQDELFQFWHAVERDMQVAKIYTEPHEPTLQGGYTDFLTRLGYLPDPKSPEWWSKGNP